MDTSKEVEQKRLENMKDKKDMKMIMKERINLGLIEPVISTYSNPGFLVRNYSEIKRGKLRWSESKKLLHSPHHRDNISGMYFQWV
ncbi:UNVERIFIED_CONTAM: hypothetical protein Sradi_0900900 [Sesamum radiatum]|uniref:Uncharacterized protein n=1 Tax=Sesamum radiatum TaxID=300843 RepID=A0AAW2V5J6_SESRA